MATRPDHLKYLDTVRPSVVIGGPQLSEDGQTMIGTYFVIDVADRAAAENQIKNDPYTKAGLFESMVIRPCRKAMP
jgi:uncharacterized protein YciI